MTRETAFKHIKENIKNKNLLKHMLATEAIMKGLAERFDEDKERWGVAGLVHDIDLDETADDPVRHSIVGSNMLKELGYDDEITYAVKVHNDAHGLERKSLMDKSLYCSDPLTGLIVAAALISPDKKLDKIDENFVLRRFDENTFARGANRAQIKACEELGLSLEEFVSIGLNSMRNISKELGL